jgi:ABC-type siderophore export system fused ATPase/permease subunit
MMSRFTHLFKARNKEHSLLEKTKVLFGARKEVNINAEGTSGYVVKHGANKGKVLGHIIRKSTSNW